MLYWPCWQSDVLWTMSPYDGLFWAFVYLRMEACIHTKQTIFGYFYLCVQTGGFTSSIICSGCGPGNNRTVRMPWCATLIDSIRFCQCNPALTIPPGTRTGAGVSQQTCRGFCSEFAGKCCTSCCAHTLRKVILLHWKGLEGCCVCRNSWQEGAIFFIFSRWSLVLFSFLISFCRFCCYSGFSPAISGYWRQGQKPFCSPACLSLSSLLLLLSFSSCPWDHTKFWIADSNSLF